MDAENIKIFEQVKAASTTLATLDDDTKNRVLLAVADAAAAHRFQQMADAACIYWNAPTSFTDGAQFGLGAEIGISTQKLGPRGPMGLEEITTYKWLIEGEGQVRS